jgi:hypothetical protein
LSVICRACLCGLIVLFWSVGIEGVAAQSATELASKGDMTQDYWKTVVSLLSAFISAVSLFVALKTRRETTRELFEERKDAIARQLTDNQELATGGRFKAERLAERLRALPSGAIPEDRRASLCAEVEVVAQFNSKYLNDRTFTADQIRSWKYDLDNAQRLRTIALAEYNISKNLANEGWAVMIATAEAALGRATKE